MKRPLGILSLGVIGAFALSGSAFGASCGTFDQLMSQSQALQAPFGDLTNPNCNNKPDESTVTDLISCFEALSGQPPRIQSEADMELSGLYGVITQCYSSGLGQQAPGQKSFDALVAATQADPTYETASMTFSETIAGMAQQGFFERQAIQVGLGISISDELQTAINDLSALPQPHDAAVTAEIAKLKSLQ